MDKILIKEKLMQKLSPKNLFSDEPMGKHCTMRCGGNAALFAVCENLGELSYLLSVAKAFGVAPLVLGNGSNTLFRDGEYDGLVVKLSGEFNDIDVDGTRIIAGSGALLAYVAKVAAANGLSGLEAVSGIPGSMGGAIFMNAGAYEHSISEVLESVTALTRDGDILEYDADELELSYRHSLFMDNGDVILSCKLQLREGDGEEISASMADYAKRRREKQPVNYPSAGSFFKRPEGGYAAKLIQDAGLKGLSVGGAEVSELHSGFIINKDNASAEDVIELSEKVIAAVKEKYGVCLEPEVRII